MSRSLADLLAADGLAQKFGCGLNPKLREAIETSLRFPAVAAGPAPAPIPVEAELPDGVIRLPLGDGAARKTA